MKPEEFVEEMNQKIADNAKFRDSIKIHHKHLPKEVIEICEDFLLIYNKQCESMIERYKNSPTIKSETIYLVRSDLHILYTNMLDVIDSIVKKYKRD